MADKISPFLQRAACVKPLELALDLFMFGLGHLQHEPGPLCGNRLIAQHSLALVSRMGPVPICKYIPLPPLVPLITKVQRGTGSLQVTQSHFPIEDG